MPNKHPFGFAGTAPRPDTSNEAGDPASAPSPEHLLAEYAVTGVLHGTFYATDEEQLAKAASLASAVRPELVAKTAVYCRPHGRMKDVPVLLVAWLASHDVELMLRVFPRVIDDARTLRTFVAIVRSGITGRKSFGSAPKRALREWFAARSPETIFRQAIGQRPSMSDVIKMVRPPPRNDKGEADAVREALYGYLIGKNVGDERLPPLTQAFEAWKRRAKDPSMGPKEPLPDVPFEMLTALPLRAEHWTELARKMTFTQLRHDLHALYRHGVFADPAIVDLVAEKLSDAEAIRRSRTLPYQLLAASRALPSSMPSWIAIALARAVEHAVANVPELSGSVAPLRWLNARGQAPDLVVVVSDNQSWAEFGLAPSTGALAGTTRRPVMTEEWDQLRATNPRAKLVLIDLQPSATPEPRTRPDVLHVGGFSDAVFDVVASFAKRTTMNDDRDGLLRAIEAVSLDSP
jgi:60 kDa SS-A/Ro ribonucleoprotein